MTSPATATFYPSTLGHSVDGRPIVFHTNAAEGTSLNTLFIGVFHGDEGISADLLLLFLQHLTDHPEALNQIPIGILPVLNPDGLANDTRTNANGVDLNRNYPTQNWAEQDQDTLYYSGPAAGSEPETQLMIKLLDATRPKKIISVHSPYKVINYDGPAQELATTMAAAITTATGIPHPYPVTADIGYPTPGSFGTYAGIEHNIPVITLELPEDEPLGKIWQETRPALLATITFQS